MDSQKARTLKVPLTNVYAKGDYSAQLQLGSQAQRVNLILDTGSSTLVVKQSTLNQGVVNQSAYRPQDDSLLTATSLAQEVNYGIGGWDGPVVTTRVTISEEKCEDEIAFDKRQPHLHLAHQPLVLDACPLAIVSSVKQQQTFGDADGILGLGYHHLNKSYDLKTYLESHKHSPAVTYPWPWPFADDKDNCQIAINKSNSQSNTDDNNHNKTQPAFSSEDLKQFKQFLWQQPEQDLIPYFTSLEEHGLIANKFAFYSQRSSIHVTNGDLSPQQLANDPLNQGWLILGGGEEHTELYQGEFHTIRVDHDIYYNVTLTSIRVGEQAPIPAPALETKYRKNYYSNAIIDTGASAIALTEPLYQAMLTSLKAISPTFAPLIAPFKAISAQETGINASLLDLSQWPDITFTFVGDTDVSINRDLNEDAVIRDGTDISDSTDKSPDTDNNVGTDKCVETLSRSQQAVSIVCRPESYWQLNAPIEGKACFKILSQLPNWPNQTLLGLPLLNDHLVIFDRSVHKTGVIRFAKQK